MGTQYTTCPICGGRKPKLMACIDCGYSYLQRIFKAPGKRSATNDVNDKKSAVQTSREYEKSPIEPINPPASKKLTSEDAAQLLKAKNDVRILENGNDKDIANYLKKNPPASQIGKFGVPQDKYRWGFYGHRTMEYDLWRKGDKKT